MRKKDELSKEHTCMQHAHLEEMVFVLLSRDAAAPVAIRAWVAERLRLGKNVETDAQIVDALECARVMETEGRLWTGPYPGLSQNKAEQLYKEMVEVSNGCSCAIMDASAPYDFGAGADTRRHAESLPKEGGN